LWTTPANAKLTSLRDAGNHNRAATEGRKNQMGGHGVRKKKRVLKMSSQSQKAKKSNFREKEKEREKKKNLKT